MDVALDEVELIGLLVGSAVFYHFSRTIFSKNSNIPGFDQVMNNNPELKRAYQEAAMREFNGQQPPNGGDGQQNGQQNGGMMNNLMNMFMGQGRWAQLTNLNGQQQQHTQQQQAQQQAQQQQKQQQQQQMQQQLPVRRTKQQRVPMEEPDDVDGLLSSLNVTDAKNTKNTTTVEMDEGELPLSDIDNYSDLTDN